LRLCGVPAQQARHAACAPHRFARHLLESEKDIPTVQDLVGHSSVGTTQIYTHVMRKPGRGVKSPLDVLAP